MARDFGKSWAEHEAYNRAKLAEYAENGVITNPYADPSDRPADQPWQSSLESNLRMFAWRRLYGLQASQAADLTPPGDALASALDAAIRATGIDYHLHARFPDRFPGRHLQMMPWDGSLYAAMGLLAGDRDGATHLAKIQSSALARGFLAQGWRCPSIELVLRLLCLELGVPLTHPMEQASQFEPTRLALRDWDGDLDAVMTALQGLADFHTHRASFAKSDYRLDFATPAWHSMPIEILLIVYLRRQKSLATPDIDHPLMTRYAAFDMDWTVGHVAPLIAQVGDRMAAQGYSRSLIESLL